MSDYCLKCSDKLLKIEESIRECRECRACNLGVFSSNCTCSYYDSYETKYLCKKCDLFFCNICYEYSNNLIDNKCNNCIQKIKNDEEKYENLLINKNNILDEEKCENILTNKNIISSNKIYLLVPYHEKEEAKKFNAKWDKDIKKWYIFNNNRDKNIVLQKWKEYYL